MTAWLAEAVPVPMLKVAAVLYLLEGRADVDVTVLAADDAEIGLSGLTNQSGYVMAVLKNDLNGSGEASPVLAHAEGGENISFRGGTSNDAVDLVQQKSQPKIGVAPIWRRFGDAKNDNRVLMLILPSVSRQKRDGLVHELTHVRKVNLVHVQLHLLDPPVLRSSILDPPHHLPPHTTSRAKRDSEPHRARDTSNLGN